MTSGAPDRDKVLEIYTFTFTYQIDPNVSQSSDRLAIDRPKKSQVHVEASIEALRTLLLQLNDLCDGLPDLPGKGSMAIAVFDAENATAKRMVSMELFYRSGYEKLYNSEGFEPARNSILRFPKVDGWKKNMHTLPALDAFFHRYVSCRVPVELRLMNSADLA